MSSIKHSHTFRIDQPVEILFPLFSAEGETLWVPEWEYTNIILEEGAEPDEKGPATPLYFASDRGHVKVAAVLIKNGADVNNLSVFGTPLQIAARKGHIEIVALLLKNGADPNLPGGEEHRTALHEAAYKGSPDIASMLLEHWHGCERPRAL